MYHYKTGYGPGEPIATHARRRYRLLPSKRPGAPMPDPSLWITHYGQAEPADRVPSNLIPIDQRGHQSIGTRTYLHAQGQIVQKEFMLNDRTNWPQIAFPRNQPRAAPMYGGNAPPTRVPQAMAYPPQHATAGPPAKRVRTQPNPNQAAAGSAVAVLDDDEEDTSRGDLFDHTTPREISESRYKQNHEWMEEVLSSPYAINQLIPVDLGLGVRGQLLGLTEGIFDAPLNPDTDIPKHNYVGRLDAEKAEEFRKRAEDQIAQTNKEMEKMQAKHAKRMAKFKRGSLITQAEKQLRSAVNDPADMGPEYWRLEGKIDAEDSEDGPAVIQILPKVSDILAQVEASLGRHAAVVQEMICVQRGGYEEPAAKPSPRAPVVPSPRVSPPASNNGSQNSGVLVDADIDMGGSAAGLLDQYHGGLSLNATPASGGFPTPQAHLQAPSSTGTPNLAAASPHPSGQTPMHQLTHADVNMADIGQSSEQPLADTSGTGDWVVVPSGGVSPTNNTAQASLNATQAPQMNAPTAGTPASASLTGNPSPHPTGSSNQTPLPDFHTSPNDFADLGDLDSAGDALAGYGEGLGGDSGGLGDLTMDMDGGMDDSAFGEAFHGVESRGDNEGDGL
jgi:hypothetical protein